MKLFLSTIALFAMIGFVGVVMAKDKGAGAAAGAGAKDALHGEISAVAADGKSITLTSKKDPAGVTVAIDANTKIKIDGKESAVADLKVGMKALVTPSTGTATLISVRTKPADPGKKKHGDTPAPAPGDAGNK